MELNPASKPQLQVSSANHRGLSEPGVDLLTTNAYILKINACYSIATCKFKICNDTLRFTTSKRDIAL
jgi:hypothetical protein